MEFVKVGKNYLIKNSGGKIVTEKEKLELENKELVYKDITSSECQGKTTQVLITNKKRIDELSKEKMQEIIKEDLETLEKVNEKIREMSESKPLPLIINLEDNKNEEHKVVEVKKPRKRKSKK